MAKWGPLAVLVLLIGSSFVPSVASAALAVEPTVLCSSTQEGRVCPEEPANVYGAGKVASGTSKNFAINSKFFGSPYAVSCKKATLKDQTTESSGTLELRGSVSSAEFAECTDSFATACTVKGTHLAYATGTSRTATVGNGTMLVWGSTTSSPPGFAATCASGLNCVYEANEEVAPEGVGSVKAFKFALNGGSPAHLAGSSLPLKMVTPEKGNCFGAEAATLTAEFEITEPKPLYVELEPVGISLDKDPVAFPKAPDTMMLKIENSSPKASWKIVQVDPLAPFKWNDVNNCLNVLIAPTKACEIEVVCTVAAVGLFTTTVRTTWNSHLAYGTEMKC
jgi:hypothetical protein